jgi:biopolymer transport protein ExbB
MTIAFLALQDTVIGSRYSLLTLFHDGGIFMYPLVLCSLIGSGIIIAKAYTLWFENRRTHSLVQEVETLVAAGRTPDAMQRCRDAAGPVAAILLTALQRVEQSGYDSDDVAAAVRSSGTVELAFLERGLPALATVSNVAPLLGFLGTVAGMISAFGAIASAGEVEASLVAAGIKVALITTAAGLTIAIPVNIAYNFFVTRIDRLILDMENAAARIRNLMWNLERHGAAS